MIQRLFDKLANKTIAQLKCKNEWLTKALGDANVELARLRCASLPNYIQNQDLRESQNQ
jgi:hypothetical protein